MLHCTVHDYTRKLQRISLEIESMIIFFINELTVIINVMESLAVGACEAREQSHSSERMSLDNRLLTIGTRRNNVNRNLSKRFDSLKVSTRTRRQPGDFGYSNR